MEVLIKVEIKTNLGY